jgi:phenylalanyl-tRNA synthetase beta chain
MHLSEHWLRQWVDPGLTLEAMAEQLTQAGIEVEALLPAAPAFSGVVTGEILSIEPHPDAAKLRVCQVAAGEGGPFQVVCGAANAAAGMKVPFAHLGARLPGDKRIGPARLRGVESQGMLCSARELGLELYGADGLWELPIDAPVGVDVRAWLHLEQRVLALKLTPNRGDCLSVRGIARELSAINRMPFAPPPPAALPELLSDTWPVVVQDKQACPTYMGRVIRGLHGAAVTPLWMQERLRLSGLRSLGPVVDVTNYVMLELGQPMHAFDLSRLEGGIQVRQATSGEQLRLLDGRILNLDTADLLIADQCKPLALAGVMGGMDSGVSADTHDVFLEAAHFSPLAIAGRARHHGLHTDSSHRFERGVDPVLPRLALDRAAALLCEIAGGRPGPVCSAGDMTASWRRQPVVLRAARIQALLGFSPQTNQVEDILNRLGVDTTPTSVGWHLRAPSHRFDLELEADYIEEIARMTGYEQLPQAMPVWPQRLRPVPEGWVPEMRFKQRLVERGYQETIGFSFISGTENLSWGADASAALTLANPISEDLAVMRQSLWPSLAKALVHNIRRQHRRVRIFEVGSIYVLHHNEIIEKKLISGICYGSVTPEQWVDRCGLSGFYDLKADVEALLSLATGGVFEARRSGHPALHPGQAVGLYSGGACVGHYGMMHPRVQLDFGLDEGVGLFEFELAALSAAVLPKFREISQFPHIRRDIAFIVDEKLPVSNLLDSIRLAVGERLKVLIPFDVYQGDGIEKGRKSVALGLIFQDDSRTLTDNEAEAILQAVQDVMQNNHGATLRE